MDYTVYNYTDHTALVYKLGANNVYHVELHAFKEVEAEEMSEDWPMVDYVINPEVINSFEIPFIDLINSYLTLDRYGDCCEAFEN